MKNRYIIYFKGKKVIAFDRQKAAQSFVEQNNKSYFNQLKIVDTKDEPITNTKNQS